MIKGKLTLSQKEKENEALINHIKLSTPRTIHKPNPHEP